MSVLKRVSASRETLFRRGSILSRFGLLEIISSALTFAAGILIVRTMGKAEYAWYTVANSMVGGMNMLTTLGVGVALMSIGGKCVGDQVALGRIMTTCVQYRTIFALLFGPLVAGTMAFMLWSNGCPWPYIAVLIAIVVLYLFVQINQDLASSLLRLVGHYNFPQTIAAAGGALRLFLLAGLAVVGAMRVWSAMLSMVAVGLLSYFAFLRPKSMEFYRRGEPTDPEVGRAIRNITYNTFPITLHAFFMPQISIFLLSVFSSSTSVADFGALGRFALVLSVPMAAINNVFQPWLARTPRASLLRSYLQIVLSGAVVSVLIVAVSAAGSSLFLDVLGANYQGLNREFVILMAVSCLNFFCNCCGVVLTARGWVGLLWLQPVLSIAATAAGCFFLDLSKLSHVLLLGALPAPLVLALYLGLAAAGFRRTADEA